MNVQQTARRCWSPNREEMPTCSAMPHLHNMPKESQIMRLTTRLGNVSINKAETMLKHTWEPPWRSTCPVSAKPHNSMSNLATHSPLNAKKHVAADECIQALRIDEPISPRGDWSVIPLLSECSKSPGTLRTTACSQRLPGSCGQGAFYCNASTINLPLGHGQSTTCVEGSPHSHQAQNSSCCHKWLTPVNSN